MQRCKLILLAAVLSLSSAVWQARDANADELPHSVEFTGGMEMAVADLDSIPEPDELDLKCPKGSEANIEVHGTATSKACLNSKGVHHGPVASWPRGVGLEITSYATGELHGPTLVWHPGGELLRVGFRKNGKRDGVELNLAEDGTITALELHGAEETTTVLLHSNGEVAKLGRRRGTLKEGLWFEWSADGRLSSACRYLIHPPDDQHRTRWNSTHCMPVDGHSKDAETVRRQTLEMLEDTWPASRR